MQAIQLTTRISVLGILTLLFFTYLMPWVPTMPSSGLDPSWVLVLTEAFKNGLLWGRDIVFTYGPAGFLITKLYDPDTYHIVLYCWFFFILTYLLGFFCLSNRANLFILISTSITLFLCIKFSNDVLLFSLPFLLLLVYFSPKSLFREIVIFLLLSATVLAAQIKLTFGFLSLVCCILLDINLIIRKRIPYFTFYWTILFIITWIFLGQRLELLVPYLHHSLHIISGYDSAMQIGGPIIEIIAYVGSVLIISTIIIFQLIKNDNLASLFDRLVITAFFLIFLFLSFKQGFIRHDLHSLISWLGLGVSTSLILHQNWILPANRIPQSMLVSLVLIVPMLGCFSLMYYRAGMTPQQITRQFGLDVFNQRIVAAIEVINGNRQPRYSENRLKRLAAIKQKHALPKLTCSVDIMSYFQGAVIASGLTYSPRPVFQSYAAYTPDLAELNKLFFESDRAPECVIFDITPIDGRLPSLEGNLSWLALLSFYQPIKDSNSYLILKRSEKPHPVELRNLNTGRAQFGETIELPSDEKRQLWMSVHVQTNLLGRLIGLLFKEPVLYIELTGEMGSSKRYRLPRKMAETGFLVSPNIVFPKDFLLLYPASSDLLDSLEQINQIRIITPGFGEQRFEPYFEFNIGLVTRKELPEP